MASYSHTYSLKNIRGMEVNGYRSCSFKSCPIKKGSKVHKGKLMSSIGTEKAMVKHYQDKSKADAAIGRLGFGEEVLKICPQATKARLRMADTFISRIEKVGKCANVNVCDDQKLRVEDQVLIQRRLEGEVRTLFSLSSDQTHDQLDDYIKDFVIQSYNVSQGQRVIAEVKGSSSTDPEGNTLWIVTSLTVHSRQGQMGTKDMGPPGVEKFEQWAAGFYRLEPTAPPMLPPYDEADNGNHPPPYNPINQGQTPHDFMLFPNPMMRKLLDMNQNPYQSQLPFPEKTSTRTRGNCNYRGSSAELYNIQNLAEQMGKREDVRNRFSPDEVNRVLGAPPPYTSSRAVLSSLRRQAGVARDKHF